MIGGDASISLDAANVFIGDDSLKPSLYLLINNFAAHVGGRVALNLVASGQVVVDSDSIFLIQNSNDKTPGGGMIGSNAEINVHAASFSTDSLQASIVNSGGSIGQDAVINFGASDDINVEGVAIFEVRNASGNIGRRATISVNAASMTAESLMVAIYNGVKGRSAPRRRLTSFLAMPSPPPATPASSS